jgi:4-azaleucine resistance transporter AzlC
MFQLVKRAFLLTIPVLLGYISVGIAYGILVIKSGVDPRIGLFMSVLVYAGAMQFVAIGLILSPLSLIQVALMTFFVNLRHIFYGLSFIDLFKKFGWKKQYMTFALTDESYSLLCALTLDEETSQEELLFTVTLFNHMYWVLGTLIGLILGRVLTFNSMGIEFAMTALFIVIFLEQWKGYKNHVPALMGLGLSWLALLTFGAGQMVLPAMVLIVAGLIGYRKPISREDLKNES